ncbi:MAG: hypothetical protein VKM17_00955 [Cyanobacteriota bacterium]|nr:hypothetical protein [Cyanobacteriota bacterium]
MFPFLFRRSAPAAAPLVATLFVLQTLEPIARRLQTVLGRSATSLDDPDGHLAREGRLSVFEGDPAAARRLERALRDLGVCTSLNLRPLGPGDQGAAGIGAL